ncbi:MAG: hypothetical protein K0R51_2483 [Cytophagaceae bacterium]|jgi:hypothetical protein|nr:hypothetical protein [Cytophagaceae bacterium]
MKKTQQIFFATALLAAVAFTSSCKKETEPGPAGANGTNGIALPYKQEGTTLKLSGTYSSDNAAFDNTYALSYFASLEENAVVEEQVEDGNGIPARTEATVTDYYYHIVRRDSLNNSVLSFDIAFYDGASDPVVENLYIDIIDNVTSSSYKRISTGYVYDPSISARISAGTANGYFDRGSLGNYEIYQDNGSNELAISDWSYDHSTKKISFEFSGVLSDYFNSTKNDLSIEAKVSADLRQETHRVGRPE